MVQFRSIRRPWCCNQDRTRHEQAAFAAMRSPDLLYSSDPRVWGERDEAARVHIVTRRRGDRVAARGARAQQAAMPVIGIWGSTASLGRGASARAAPKLGRGGIRRGLSNVAIEYSWGGGPDYDRLPAQAAASRCVAELRGHLGYGLRCHPAVAAKAATTTIPIVFVMGADPVKLRRSREPQPAGRQRDGTDAVIHGVFGGKAAGAHPRTRSGGSVVLPSSPILVIL